MAKVSVGLPVYNGEAYLGQALDSILGQTFSDLEVVISDNCSTDRTAEICEAYVRADRRVRYVRQPRDVGAAANFGDVFSMTTGEYFKWAAHDDVLAPRFLEECVDVLDRERDVVLCWSQVQLIDENGRPIITSATANDHGESTATVFPATGRRGIGKRVPASYVHTSSADPVVRFREVLFCEDSTYPVFGLMRGEALARTRLIDSYFGSDRVLLAHLALLGKFYRVDQPLMMNRCHERQSSNLSRRARAMWISGGRSQTWQPLRQVAGAIHATFAADLTARQRLECLKVRWERTFTTNRVRQLFFMMLNQDG